jgi:glutamate/tyrosine decarboxylase-like PLP-dependent enzyme
MGHMVSEISLAALFGHIVALLHNPNNSSLSSSKVGSIIEQEAIDSLSEMIGYDGPGVGHFTSGGTIANIEAIWRARFRLDHAIALGAYENENHQKQHSIFEAAHHSIDCHLNKEETKPYSFVQLGAFAAFSLYQKVFKIDFQGPILIVPAHKHYSWQKAVSLLGLGEEALWIVELDTKGHMNVSNLKEKIEFAKKTNRPILAVVSVAGTTELGMVDPIDEVQDLLDEYKKDDIHIWHHVDAAYGGIYTSMISDSEVNQGLSPYSIKALRALNRAESITLDPHKLALVPYACGAIIVKDEKSYAVSEFYAPYLKEKPQQSGKWVSTIEGSRPATGASATWMVARTIGLNNDGMGRILALGLKAKKNIIESLSKKINHLQFIPETDTNIICFTFIDEDKSMKKANAITRKIYEQIDEGDQFSVSQTTLNKAYYREYIENLERTWTIKIEDENLYLIRMVIMNPFSTSKENRFNYIEEFSTYLLGLYNDLSANKQF